MEKGGGRTVGTTQDMKDVVNFNVKKKQNHTGKKGNEGGKMKEGEVKMGEQTGEPKLYMK